MLTQNRTKNLSSTLRKAVDEALIKKGVSARRASMDVVGHDGLIRDIRAGKMPGFDRVLELLNYLDVRSINGFPTCEVEATDALWGADLPLRGFAKCSQFGVLTDRLDLEPLPGPLWMDDPEAFWVQAMGSSMRPEGIRSGDYCLVSPAEPLTIGARVYIKDVTQAGPTLKRLLSIDETSYRVRGWNEIVDGTQQDYEINVVKSAVSEIYPIVADYRGRPGSVEANSRLIPDPKTDLGHAPLLLPVDLVTPPEVPTGAIEPNRLGFETNWLQRLGAVYATTIMVMCPDHSVEQSIPVGASVLVSMASGQYLGPGIYLIDLPDGSRSFRRVEELEGGGHILRADDGRKTAVLSPRDVKSGMLVGKAVWFGTEVA